MDIWTTRKFHHLLSWVNIYLLHGVWNISGEWGRIQTSTCIWRSSYGQSQTIIVHGQTWNTKRNPVLTLSCWVKQSIFSDKVFQTSAWFFFMKFNSSCSNSSSPSIDEVTIVNSSCRPCKLSISASTEVRKASSLSNLQSTEHFDFTDDKKANSMYVLVYQGKGRILSWLWDSRLAMRRSTWVPPKCPVQRPPGTDNSAHGQVAKQPRTPIGMANPGRVTRLGMIP